MERRKFLIGAGSTAIGASALVGSGAFSSVEAHRDVSVHVENDSNAYLGLTGDNTYVGDDSGSGMLSINLGGPQTADGGKGFNDDAITTVDSVVTIENQGTKTVDVSLDQSSVAAGVTFGFDGDNTLSPGESVGLNATVDTLNEDPSGSAGTLVIEANEQ